MKFPFPEKIHAPAAINNLIDRSGLHHSYPFNPETEVHIPKGKYTCVHYGSMFPNLPAPFNFLNLLTVIGQPKIKLFRNHHLIKTTDIDTTNVLIGTAVGTADHFNGYSVQNDCELSADGSSLRFGNDLLLDGKYPNFHAKREGHDFNFELNIKATDKVANFAELFGGVYDHWSLLCQYQGYLEYQGKKTDIQGLCTYEYARGVNINLPMRYFTYHIINIDERTQVLLVEIIGSFNLVMQQRVYVRSLDDYGDIYSDGFELNVHEFYPTRSITPNGLSMRLPHQFSWQVNNHSGQPLITIEGTSNHDFQYDMAGGYAGSYQYTGAFQGKAITGTGYIEYLDIR
ncbi:hypothetical protein QSV37_07460 [Acinetobacter sp. VNK23]|uniref:DUF6670 family protein n=1 Tax=Acinetobacter thutiue TaxID=2998078 RepID=UPI002577ADF9|nr:DUF6670 family protein [Acinetobacter thutiue]MDM1020143.1 hypothetical protein [Acinetobacter thutiue]